MVFIVQKVQKNSHVSMTDIASYAKVSQSTVSRILSGAGMFRPETREKVFDALTALGYKSHILCLLEQKNWKKMRFELFMCPLPEQKNALEIGFYNNIITGVSEYLLERSLPLQVHLLRSGMMELPLNEKPDGIFLVGYPALSLRKKLRMQGIPYLCIVGSENYMSDEDLVTTNSFETGIEACRYLLSRGSRRIGYILNFQHEDLCAGIEMELRRSGIEILPQDRHMIASTDVSAAVAELCEWLSEGDMPEALFINHMDTVDAILPILRMQNIRVPQDLKLFSFGSTFSQKEYPVPAFCMDPILEGKTAAKRLLEKIRDPQEHPFQIIIPMRLVLPKNNIKKGDNA